MAMDNFPPSGRTCFLVFLVFNFPVDLKISKSNERTSPAASDHEILKSLLANYGDPKTAPTPGPVAVRIELTTHYSPTLINRYGWPVLEMTNLWIVQHWSDQRLNFRRLGGGPGFKNVSLPLAEMSKIWTPGLIAVNDLELKIRSSPKENVFVVVSEDGQVLVSTRVSVLAPCQTNCADEIRCKLMLESGSENIEKEGLTHHLTWNRSEVKFFPDGGGKDVELGWTDSHIHPTTVGHLGKWSFYEYKKQKQTKIYSYGAFHSLEAIFKFKHNSKNCPVDF